MRYFIDLEFIEDGRTIDPISLAIVPDFNIHSLYLEFANAPFHRANSWVRQNVLPHLGRTMSGGKHCVYQVDTSREAASLINSYIGLDSCPEFWGYYCDYDWVAICQLFGDMSALPPAWPRYCNDLRQFLDERGLESVKQFDPVHHALDDAEWIRDTWNQYRYYRQDNPTQ